MNYKDKILILPCGGSEFEKINPAFLDRVDNPPWPDDDHRAGQPPSWRPHQCRAA